MFHIKGNVCMLNDSYGNDLFYYKQKKRIIFATLQLSTILLYIKNKTNKLALIYYRNIFSLPSQLLLEKNI